MCLCALRNIMKKMIFVLLILAALCLTGCSPEDAGHSGLSAEIIEIDGNNYVIYVADPDDKEIFGDKCAIDCTELTANEKLIYVDFETGELTYIQFSNLQVGDMLAIDAYESGLESVAYAKAVVEQIQLVTQR